MKKDACTTFDAIWCGKYTQFDVNKYFEDEKNIILSKNKGPIEFKIRRLINNDRNNIDKHRELMKDVINKKYYEIEETDVCNFELVYSDYEHEGSLADRALFIFLDIRGIPKLGVSFDSGVHPEVSSITQTIKKIFDRFWSKKEGGE